METLSLHDPDWLTTFPRRVTPIADEWLPGLLLRCDDANFWRSGTAVRYIMHTLPRSAPIQEFNPLIPSDGFLKHLAKTLKIPVNLMEETTYRLELARLSGVHHPQLDRVHVWRELSICPECLAQQQVLRRSLMLSSITCCPEHSLRLRSWCQCRQNLSLFSGGEPFACPDCGLEWKKLPREKPSWREAARSQIFFSYYEFFFLKGTPQIFSAAWKLIGKRRLESEWKYGPGSYKKHVSKKLIGLGYMISLLIKAGISIEKIVDYAIWCSLEEKTISFPLTSE